MTGNLTIDQEIQKERVRAIVRTARSLADRMRLERAFEHAGCSCGPMRKQLDALEKEEAEEIDRIEERYREAKEELKRGIAAIDRKEHPDLDRMSFQSREYVVTWLLQRSKDGVNLFEADLEQLQEAYVAAWMGGWRP